MAELYDISKWSQQPWWNTGGTRNKKVYLNPENGKLYYFKESLRKEGKDYKYEFWSEIVASEVGKQLGFDILPYHIAIRRETVGCISESMIDLATEELVEGGKYLQAFDNTFDPEDRKLRFQYDVQLILGALRFFGLEKFYVNFIESILFDALIGNSDRHQENWAAISTHSGLSRSTAEMEKDLAEGLPESTPGLVKRFFQDLLMKGGKVRPEIKAVSSVFFSKGIRFAPIYDSGCSFGRELSDEKVLNMLSDQNQLNSYLNKGMAEIHWEGQKINHFELLDRILSEDDFRGMLLESMGRVLNNYEEKRISDLIRQVDHPLKQAGVDAGLPDERKALMIKLLALRRERIAALYSQYQK